MSDTLQFTRHPELDFTLFVGGPELTLAGWMEAMEAYAAAGATRHELYDLRLVGDGIGPDEVRQLVDHAKKSSHLREPGSMTALCVTREVQVGLSRMYELSTEGHVNWETAVFVDMEAARTWLGIDLAGVEGIN